MTEEKNKKLGNIYPRGENVLIVLHKDPDGDCFASGCILRELLILDGFNPDNIHFLSDGLPEKEHLFKGIPDINFIEEQDIKDKTTAYLVDHQKLLVSCINNLFNEKIIERVFIDHHYHIDELGIFDEASVKQLIDRTKYSTTDLIYETFKEGIQGIEDKEVRGRIATFVYAGIYYDSGRFISGTKKDFVIKLKELIDLGADVDEANLVGFLSYGNREREISVAMRACNKDRHVPIVKVDGFKNPGSGKYVSKSGFSKEYLYGRLLMCKDVKHVFAIYPQFENHKFIVHIRTKEPEIFKLLEIESWRKDSHTFLGLTYEKAEDLFKKFRKAAVSLKRNKVESTKTPSPLKIKNNF